MESRSSSQLRSNSDGRYLTAFGLFDSKDIETTKRHNSGSRYNNHKGVSSIVLLAVVDADLSSFS